ncbi:hypothetical protein [Scytonema sp. NUACC26]|uniref:hypothetical protein n=1 Tax=Scytonema sp. NUACC26 TaxID=3140176 RepID=UPI0038B34302
MRIYFLEIRAHILLNFIAILTFVRYGKRELTAACSGWTLINSYLRKLENAIVVRSPKLQIPN